MASAPSLSHHFATSMVSASTLPFFSHGNDVVAVDRAELDLQMEVVADARTDRPDHFQQEARAILQRPAILVGAVVDAGGEKLGEQVAVGCMQLDAIEPGLARAPGAGGERIHELIDLGLPAARQRNPCSDSRGWSSSTTDDGNCARPADPSAGRNG